MLSANERSKMVACILLNIKRISIDSITSFCNISSDQLFFYLLYHKYHLKEPKGAMS